MFSNEISQLVYTPNWATINHAVMEFGIVINESRHPIIRPMVKRIEQLSTRIARAIDNHATHFRLGANLVQRS